MKCVRYWPTGEDSAAVYGNVEVTLVKEIVLPHYTIRHLEATHVSHVDMCHITGVDDLNVSHCFV